MSAADINSARILKAISLGDDTFDRLAETFDVAFNHFGLRRDVYALRGQGLLRQAGREGAEARFAVIAKPKTRRRAA